MGPNINGSPACNNSRCFVQSKLKAAEPDESRGGTRIRFGHNALLGRSYANEGLALSATFCRSSRQHPLSGATVLREPVGENVPASRLDVASSIKRRRSQIKLERLTLFNGSASPFLICRSESPGRPSRRVSFCIRCRRR